MGMGGTHTSVMVQALQVSCRVASCWPFLQNARFVRLCMLSPPPNSYNQRTCMSISSAWPSYEKLYRGKGREKSQSSGQLLECKFSHSFHYSSACLSRAPARHSLTCRCTYLDLSTYLYAAGLSFFKGPASPVFIFLRWGVGSLSYHDCSIWVTSKTRPSMRFKRNISRHLFRHIDS